MKSITRVFCALWFATPVFGAFANTPVATTAGNNLTAFNPSNANNNQWASMINERNNGAPTAKVDFGNCNALILRCAQPKCANGGCSDMNVAGAIVSGCVQSNENCKQYGNDLISYMSAQLVASSNAKINEANAQQAAIAQQQSQQQMAQMQQQMQQQMAQMQQAMQQQSEANAQQMAQMQQAMQQQTQQAINNVSAAATAAAQQTESGITVAQEKAIEKGVSEDVLMRQQIGNQILTKIEDAEVSLKELKTVMEDTFDYAGCDRTGSNCSGPKRVKIFKEKALKFFEPYDSVADKLSEALELAMVVGVDISDIYMLMNGACNRWAKYVCIGTKVDNNTVSTGDYVSTVYTDTNCKNGKSISDGFVRGGASCKNNQIVPPTDDTRCTFTELVDESTEDLTDVMLSPETDSDHNSTIRLGCMSDAVNGLLGISCRSKKSASTIDIDTFERMITQDATSTSLSKYGKVNPSLTGYCAVDAADVTELERYVSMKGLPQGNKLCKTTQDISKNDKMYDSVTSGCSDFCKATDEESKCYKQCKACETYPGAVWNTSYSSVGSSGTTSNNCNCTVFGEGVGFKYSGDAWVCDVSQDQCMAKKCEWKNNKCDCLKKMKCTDRGESWDGSKCTDDQGMCKKLKGTWEIIDSVTNNGEKQGQCKGLRDICVNHRQGCVWDLNTGCTCGGSSTDVTFIENINSIKEEHRAN